MMKKQEISDSNIPKKRTDIQIIRGLSIITVVLFHFFPSIFRNGFGGVDIFFVISGYLVIPKINAIFQDNFGLKDVTLNLMLFFKKRYFRLAPALGISILISVVLFALFTSVAAYVPIEKMGIATLLLLGNFGAYKFAGDYFHPLQNPFIHYWSLSVEEQFYIVTPSIFFLVYLFSKKRNYSVVLVSMLSTSFLIFLFPRIEILHSLFIHINQNQEFQFYSPIPRLWEFSLGGLIAIKKFTVINILLRQKTRYILIILGLILIVTPVTSPKLVSVLACMISGQYLAYCQKYPAFESGDHALLTKIAIYMGDRSYSIYLIHMPLASIIMHSSLHGIHLLLAKLVTLGIMFFLAEFIFLYVENRFRPVWRRSSMTQAIFSFQIFPALVLILLGTISLNYKVSYGSDQASRMVNPVTVDRNCWIKEGTSPCKYTKSNYSKSILLIGDSHAGQYTEILREISKNIKANYYSWVRVGCSIGNSDVDSNLKDSCSILNFNRLELLKHSNIDVLIISEKITKDTNLVNFVKFINKTQNFGVEIIVMGQNPVFPDGAKFGAVGSLAFPIKYQAPLKFTEDKMDIANMRYGEEMEKKIKDMDLMFFNTVPYFCQDHICSRFENGQWLFTDVEHLSTFGAKKVASNLQLSIISLLKKDRIIPLP